MKLKHYHQRRRFTHTPEPKGKLKKSSSHLFVIQKHAARHLHYDFRLEMDGVLKSWAIPKGPSLDPKVKRLAVQVEDHPIEYASFEGFIPKGEYGAGSVMIWDKGKWQQVEFSEKPKKDKSITFVLNGKKLKGLWTLVPLSHDPKNWLLIKIQDEYARSNYNVTENEPLSVVSKKTMSDIIVKTHPKHVAQLPTQIKPQLATLVDKPPVGKNWLHECKLDGYRLLCFIEDKIKFITRGQIDWTNTFRDLVKEMKKLNLSRSILDGEVVALDKNGLPNFQLLQNVLHKNKKAELVYYVFDLLFYQGIDLTQKPLIERKALLKQILPKDHGLIRYTEHIQGSGNEVFDSACQLGFEGIVSKNINSTYLQKRTKNWLKIKKINRQEFIVAGFTHAKVKGDLFGALLLGYYDKKKQFHYCGRVGTGFNRENLPELNRLLNQYQTKQCPFVEKPKVKELSSWVKPQIVVEIEFKEWTNEGSLRHPSFKGIRIDKSHDDIFKEKKTQLPTQISHADKVLYPNQSITKGQVADLYLHIHQWILPYIINRPLSLLRCPNGIDQTCFFQKHLDKRSKMLSLHRIVIDKVSESDPYIYIDDLDGLLQLIQLNVLEIHPWGAKCDKIDKPDLMIFDLDPSPEVSWKDLANMAFIIKDELNHYDLQPFVKTTGGKGLHLSIPIQHRYQWEDILHFSKVFAEYIATKYPTQTTNIMTKAKRTNKIYIDYLRNFKGSTAVAPYSIRARESAPIATPLDWSELSAKTKPVYTIENIEQRLAKLKRDPWKDFFLVKQKLPKLK
ncbi:MAG: DNA ligase D [Candidatus Berkiellales bacterium]